MSSLVSLFNSLPPEYKAAAGVLAVKFGTDAIKKVSPKLSKGQKHAVVVALSTGATIVGALTQAGVQGSGVTLAGQAIGLALGAVGVHEVASAASDALAGKASTQ